MPARQLRFLVAVLVLSVPTFARAESPDRVALTASLQAIVDDYLAKNASVEGITAVSASVSLPGGDDPNINVVAGKMSKAADAPSITPDTLFPIGSITSR